MYGQCLVAIGKMFSESDPTARMDLLESLELSGTVPVDPFGSLTTWLEEGTGP